VSKPQWLSIAITAVMTVSVWCGTVATIEYPIIANPGGSGIKGVGQKLESLFSITSETLEPTDNPQPVQTPALQTSIVQAIPAASSVTVNGIRVSFEAYIIDGRTYFKLRDLAMALNGSGKQFEVTWDGARNAINLLSAQTYSVNGGEMVWSGHSGNKNAVLSTAKVYIDGSPATLTAYIIEGRTYFKLRDLGQAMNFSVSWDSSTNTININTAADYIPE